MKVKEHTYRLITNSYLASGKDGYHNFGEIEYKEDTGFFEVESFLEYLQDKKIIGIPENTGIVME